MVLLLLNFLQEADLVIEIGTDASLTADSYSSLMINALDYFMLRVDGGEPNTVLGSQTSHYILFYVSLAFNAFILMSVLLLGLVFVHH